VSYPKFSPTADPRVRIAQHGPRNFRTEVQDEPGGEWAGSGPAHLTRAEALEAVDTVCTLRFGEPTHDAIRSLRAQVERLTAERDELQRKVYAEKRHNGALMVDGDRRVQRALAKLPDCEAHRTELQYLRHCVSWYWDSMNSAEQARRAIVASLLLTVRGLDNTDGTVKSADVAAWLNKAVKAQDKPLARHYYPTLADCLRSAAGTCEHEGISDAVKNEIAGALGLTPVKS
jgi:hypothetical protein